ncbi:elongation factor 1-alpha, putative, partial [Eimeria tenella]
MKEKKKDKKELLSTSARGVCTPQQQTWSFSTPPATATSSQTSSALCVQTAGFHKACVRIVPVAALPGVNLVPQQQQQQQQLLLLELAAAKRSAHTQDAVSHLQQMVQQQQKQQQQLLQWWKGGSLLETIEAVPAEASRSNCCCSSSSSSSSGFAAVVSDVWRSGDTLVMSFKVVRGTLKTGDLVLLLPGRQQLRALQLHCGSSSSSSSGSSSGSSGSSSNIVASCSSGQFVLEGAFSCASIEETAAAAAAGCVLCSSKELLPTPQLLQASLLCLDTEMPLLPGRQLW